jgi:hypothetical protein
MSMPRRTSDSSSTSWPITAEAATSHQDSIVLPFGEEHRDRFEAFRELVRDRWLAPWAAGVAELSIEVGRERVLDADLAQVLHEAP